MVITYASRSVKEQEMNYPTHNLYHQEWCFAYKIWKHYLYGVNLDVFIDHKSVQYVHLERV